MTFLLYNLYFLLLALIYRVLYAKHGALTWNRWLLLSTPVFLLLIVSANTLFTVDSSLIVVEFESITIQPLVPQEKVVAREMTLEGWISLVYIAGVVFCMVRHSVNGFRVYQLIKRAQLLKKEGVASVYKADFNASFFNTIFLKKGLSQAHERIVLTHELAHVNQKHSYDRIIALIVQSVCWFNPGVYLWKQDIERNQEYLADQEVLKNIEKDEYARFLIEQKLKLNQYQLQLPLSRMSNLKNRVMRMKRKKRSVLSYLILTVLAAGMMSSKWIPVAENAVESAVSNPSVHQDPIKDPDENAKFKGGVEAMRAYIQKNIEYPDESLKNEVEGKVFVQAVVSAEGKIREVEVLRGVDEQIDASGKRMVEEMPDWIPATKDGEPVASKIIIPINFDLNSATQD